MLSFAVASSVLGKSLPSLLKRDSVDSDGAYLSSINSLVGRHNRDD